MNNPNRERLIDREQADSSGKVVRGWRDGAKRKKDSWMGTTVLQLQGGGE